MRLRLYRDAPAVLLNDLFANGEPDAGANALLAMRALKDLEQLADLLRVNADAIIAHGKLTVLCFFDGGDMDTWWLRGAELQCTAHQVLEHLSYADGVALDCGKALWVMTAPHSVIWACTPLSTWPVRLHSL